MKDNSKKIEETKNKIKTIELEVEYLAKTCENLVYYVIIYFGFAAGLICAPLILKTTFGSIESNIPIMLGISLLIISPIVYEIGNPTVRLNNKKSRLESTRTLLKIYESKPFRDKGYEDHMHCRQYNPGTTDEIELISYREGWGKGKKEAEFRTKRDYNPINKDTLTNLKE